MRKNKLLLLSAIFAILLVSCGSNNTLVNNHNINNTNVELSKKNFKVLQRVSGSEKTTYVLGLGGMSSEELYNTAISKMFNSAELKGSQTIINIISETHTEMVLPFYSAKTITVSGTVIEFTE